MNPNKLTEKERMKEVVYLGKTITYQEKYALKKLIKAIGSPKGPNDRSTHKNIYLKTKNGHATEISLRQKEYTTESFPKAIKFLKWLIKLDLSWNDKLKELPEEFGELESLKDFKMEYSGLTSLPDSFCNLSKLKKLSLDMNRLETLPENFGMLGSLKTLDLRNNSLIKLPKSFGNLAKLGTFNLESSRMPKLPKSFVDLKNLKSLKIGEYQAAHFPKTVAAKLKAKGCSITYTARVWQGGPGGNYETEYFWL